MSWQGARCVERALVAGVALLLTAGVLSATTLDPGPATTVAADGRVVPVGLGHSLLDEPAPAGPLGVPVAPDAPPPAEPGPSTTAPSKALTTTPAPPGPPTSPPKSGDTTTLTPGPSRSIPAKSSWEATAEGASARMRIEPAAPTAGQPVRIHLDFSGVNACCYIQLHFGDDSEKFALNAHWMCEGVSPLAPGAHSTVVTHTYAQPGAYRAYLTVLDGDLCTLPPVPPSEGPSPLHHVEIHACVAVGPGPAADGGCEGLPTSGPIFPR